MIKKIGKLLLKPFLGKKYLQKFFSGLFFLGIKGMNIGGGSTFDESGESWVLKFVAKKFSKSTQLTMFDVGANIGGYAKVASDIFGKTLKNYKIYCFEPSVNTYNKLVSNTNSMSNIQTFGVALGLLDEEANLYSNEEGSGLASLYNRDMRHAGVLLRQWEKVKVVTLDSFCKLNNINRINFLKIDVEGFELNVLRGSKDMLNKGAIDIIQFEFGGTAIDARIYFKDFYQLLSADFKIYRILQDGLWELKQYEERQELFITTNFLAVRNNLS